MSEEKLKESLRALNDDLSLDSHEEGMAEIAQDLSLQIYEVLDHPGEFPFEHHRQLMTALVDAAEAFEVSHPRLTSTINSVITSLNAIGL